MKDIIPGLLLFLFSPVGLTIALLAFGLIFFWKLTITILVVGAFLHDA